MIVHVVWDLELDAPAGAECEDGECMALAVYDHAEDAHAAATRQHRGQYEVREMVLAEAPPGGHVLVRREAAEPLRLDADCPPIADTMRAPPLWATPGTDGRLR